jgi:hypothetical protein
MCVQYPAKKSEQENSIFWSDFRLEKKVYENQERHSSSNKAVKSLYGLIWSKEDWGLLCDLFVKLSWFCLCETYSLTSSSRTFKAFWRALLSLKYLCATNSSGAEFFSTQPPCLNHLSKIAYYSSPVITPFGNE